MTAFVQTRGRLLFERNLMVYRRSWLIIFSGLFEPLFYLFSIGFGLGHYVGSVNGVSYASFIAPALLAWNWNVAVVLVEPATGGVSM